MLLRGGESYPALIFVSATPPRIEKFTMWKATRKAIPFFNNRKPCGESLLEGFLCVRHFLKGGIYDEIFRSPVRIAGNTDY